MKLRGVGFCMGKQVQAEECSFSAFFNWLSDQNALQKLWPYGKNYSRALSTTAFVNNSDPNVVMGFFVSKRSSDTSLFVDIQGTDIVVTPMPDADNPRREINIFAIRRDTWRGIYSNYEGSYACSLFIRDLWQVYLGFVREKQQELDPGDERIRDFSTRGHGTYDILTSIAKFEENVKALQALSEVKYRIYSVKAPRGAPLTENDIKSELRCIALKTYKPTNAFFLWAKGFAKKTRRPRKNGHGSVQFSVAGKTHAGQTVSIPFEDFAEDYLQMDFGNLGIVKLSDLQNNEVMEKILHQLSHKVEFT